ncbi:MAG: O-antigen ligase family protein [Pyrinomonadaceae bacterium]
MTTSIYNASAQEAAVATPTSPRNAESPVAAKAQGTINARLQTAPVEPVRTLWSRFLILVLCMAMVLSTIAFGTVHSWSLAIFQFGAAVIVVLWCMDGWRSRNLRLSFNPLQLPLVGLLLCGVAQLWPVSGANGNSSALSSIKTLSLDPYATRLALMQILALTIYFAAALAFIDSPRRLRLMVRVISIFGFVLAIFGLIQFFTSPTKIYWFRQPPQSIPFGPFINRHHFAGYMEMTLALPLGLLFSGAIEGDKRLLYAFAAGIMAVALVMTGSRGGIVSLTAAVFFLLVIAGARRRRRRRRKGGGKREAESTADEVADERRQRVQSALVRAGIGFGLMTMLLLGVIWLGGESALSRLVGTVNADDPTTGRTHFWGVTLDIIRHYPVLGTGLGSFGLAYTQYDSGGGLMRVEQAHNDYLQVLSDAGIVGAAFGLFFLVALFRMSFARRESEDKFRRGVAIGALTGCFAVLVHSFFDFTLHTTSNALLFLIMAALATLNGRVESTPAGSSRRRRRRSSRTDETAIGTQTDATNSAVPDTSVAPPELATQNEG